MRENSVLLQDHLSIKLSTLLFLSCKLCRERLCSRAGQTHDASYDGLVGLEDKWYKAAGRSADTGPDQTSRTSNIMNKYLDHNFIKINIKLTFTTGSTRHSDLKH